MKRIKFNKLQTFSEKRFRGGQRMMVMTSEIAPIGIARGEPPQNIWLWAGNVYDRGGYQLEENQYPDWLWDELTKVSKEKLERAGWLEKFVHYETEVKQALEAEKEAQRKAKEEVYKEEVRKEAMKLAEEMMAQQRKKPGPKPKDSAWQQQ